MKLLSKNKLAELRSLRSRKFREKLHLSYVEGETAVSEILAGNANVKYLLFTESKFENYISNFAGKQSEGIDIFGLADNDFTEISDMVNSQGVLAVVEFPKFIQHKEIENFSKILVFDRIQDPGNVGTLLRSANAFGVELVISLSGTVEIMNPKVLRSSAGLIYRLKYAPNINAEDFKEFVYEGSCNVYAADMEGEDFYECNFLEPWMLILGNEGSGISDEFRNETIQLVKIPHEKNVDSLNVGVAGSVILSWIHKQRQSD